MADNPYGIALPRSVFVEFEKRFRATLHQFSLGLADIPEMNGMVGTVTLGEDTIHRLIGCALDDLPPVSADKPTPGDDEELTKHDIEILACYGIKEPWSGRDMLPVLRTLADTRTELATANLAVKRLTDTIERQAETLMRCEVCAELRPNKCLVLCDDCDPTTTKET